MWRNILSFHLFILFGKLFFFYHESKGKQGKEETEKERQERTHKVKVVQRKKGKEGRRNAFLPQRRRPVFCPWEADW
jgi:hypothetical protein